MQARELPGRAEVEAALAEVYARADLSPPPPSALRVWLDELWQSLREVLAGLAPDLQVGGEALRVVAWLVIGFLVIVGLVVLLHFAGVGARWWRSRERLARREAPTTTDPNAPAGALDWETRARSAAEAGRWRDAALALYQALLLRLESRGALRYDAAKTPGDYRREVRAHGGAARLLNAFLRAFEPGVFGSRPLDREGYGRLQSLAAEAGAHG